jgi:hypothetical protein
MISALSTPEHWVTIAHLRACSESYPHSQARFMDCHCIKPQKGIFLTLARPRYLFGGLRPRETPTLSSTPIRNELFSLARVVSQEPGT